MPGERIRSQSSSIIVCAVLLIPPLGSKECISVVTLVRRSFKTGARSLKGAVAEAVIEDAKEDNAGSVFGDSIIASICGNRIKRGS